MDKYLQEIKLQMEQQNIPTELRHQIISSLMDFTKNNNEDEIIELLGEPQKFLEDYLKYEVNSHNVNNSLTIEENDQTIKVDKLPLSSDIPKIVSTPNEVSGSLNQSPNTKTRFDTVHNKLFQVIYYWVLIFPLKLVAFLIMFICLFASIAIYFSPLSSQDLNTALIVLNISIYLVYSSFLALLQLLRDVINRYLLGGK